MLVPDSREINPEFIREFRKTRRHLPHWQAPGETHFLTYALLERNACDLTTPPLARVIVDALQFRHDERYLLWQIRAIGRGGGTASSAGGIRGRKNG